jgi:hypothetical protein
MIEEKQRFIDKSEELWKLFLLCGNDLTVSERKEVIEEIDILSRDESLTNYAQCYSTFHSAALRYT